MTRSHPEIILKIPLAYLQGRGDLRAYNLDGSPVVWWKAMFFATKKQIMETSVNRIRCGAVHWPIRWPTHKNKIIQDMGWHIAWMGGDETRKVKAESFAHAFDSFAWMPSVRGYGEYGKLDSSLMEEGPAPDGNVNHIVKRFPLDQLPSLALEDPEIREFLLPTTKLDEDFQFNKCNCFWCQKLKFPLM